MLFVKLNYGDQMNEDEITGACSTHWKEVRTKFRSKLKAQDGRGGWRKTGKRVLKEQDVDWIHLAQEMDPGHGRTLIGKE